MKSWSHIFLAILLGKMIRIVDNDISVNRLIDFQVLLNLFLLRNMELEVD